MSDEIQGRVAELLREVRRQAHDIGWSNRALRFDKGALDESRLAAEVPQLEDHDILALLSAPATPRPLECSVCGAGYIGSRAGEECGVEGCDGRLYFVVAGTGEPSGREEIIQAYADEVQRLDAGYPSICVRCKRPIQGVIDLYRCAECGLAFHDDCIRAHFADHRSPAPTAAEPEEGGAERGVASAVRSPPGASPRMYAEGSARGVRPCRRSAPRPRHPGSGMRLNGHVLVPCWIRTGMTGKREGLRCERCGRRFMSKAVPSQHPCLATPEAEGGST